MWDVKVLPVAQPAGADGAAGSVVLVTMNTSKANQINPAFIADLNAALDRVEAIHPKPYAMLLTGQGAVFSSGLDVFALFNDPAVTRQFIGTYEAAMCRVLRLPMITVSVLNGHVCAMCPCSAVGCVHVDDPQTLAGGCVLALACDFRVSVTGSFLIGMDEVRNNVPFPRATMEIVKYALTGRCSRLALLLGYHWSPSDALRDGVIDSLAANVDDAINKAIELTRVPPIAAAAIATNKAYLLQTAVKAMEGETYDQFVRFCYTPEAQHQFQSARSRIEQKRKSAPASVPVPRVVPTGTGTDIIAEKKGFVYQIMRQQHFEAAVAAILEVWVHDFIFCHHLKITEEEYRPLAMVEVQRAIDFGCSLVAVHQESGEVAGFFVWEDMLAKPANMGLSLTPKFDPFFQFFNELVSDYKTQLKPSIVPGQVLHGTHGGVRKKFSDQDVVTQLLDNSRIVAARRGFQLMVTEAVVVGSQYVSYKLGWRDVLFKPYATFEWNRTKPFAKLPLLARSPCAVVFELDVNPTSSRL